MTFSQATFEVRCEWGQQGIIHLAPLSDVVIIVDVLSFSTCVEIATNRGAIVYPYQWKDDLAVEFARSRQAELASKRGSGSYSLSPASLSEIPSESRLVLPSPNGSTLSLSTGSVPTLAGCLRNCQAVALAAMTFGNRIAIIPAGEKWPDGSLRLAFEDWIGAGAIVHYLAGSRSPEAQAAALTYEAVQSQLRTLMQQCGSGQELIERGFEQDVELAVALNVSDCVPILVNNSYVKGDSRKRDRRVNRSSMVEV